MMVVVTVIFVICYKYRCLKVIFQLHFFDFPFFSYPFVVYICLVRSFNRDVTWYLWWILNLVREIRKKKEKKLRKGCRKNRKWIAFRIFHSLNSFSTIFSSHNIPLDYITFFILIWNISAVGMLSIFWHAPMRVNQGYLIFISSIMVCHSFLFFLWLKIEFHLFHFLRFFPFFSFFSSFSFHFLYFPSFPSLFLH